MILMRTLMKGKSQNEDFSTNTVKEADCIKYQGDFSLEEYENFPFKPKLLWFDVFWIVFLHLGFLYGLFLMLTNQVKLLTVLCAALVGMLSGLGLAAGAHRYWSHRSYKAKIPLQIILVLLFSISGQGNLLTWSINHRMHHRYTGTVADPHDPRRGFWFAHIGWFVMTAHPAVKNREEVVLRESKDILDDFMVRAQIILFLPLFLLFCVIIPVWIPYYYWNESLVNSFMVCFLTRYTYTVNLVFCVNSFAHLWGKRPHNRLTQSTNVTWLNYLSMGEGWHNYHHVYPWDYRSSEVDKFCFTTAFIDFFARIGWAYDLKTAEPSVVKKNARLHGDGNFT